MGDNNDCVDNNNGDANDSVKKPTKDKMDAFGLHFRGEYLDSTAVSIFIDILVALTNTVFVN